MVIIDSCVLKTNVLAAIALAILILPVTTSILTALTLLPSLLKYAPILIRTVEVSGLLRTAAVSGLLQIAVASGLLESRSLLPPLPMVLGLLKVSI